MTQILDKLIIGDLRSIRKSPEVVELVLGDPALFEEVFFGMVHEDPGVRMRAADAVEKITRKKPEYLRPYKTDLIQKVLLQEQQEVRWHAAQMIARLNLDNIEMEQVVNALFGFLEDDSKIVQVNSLQALADLAEKNPNLLPRVTKALERKVETGSPAVKNRAQKLRINLVRKREEKSS